MIPAVVIGLIYNKARRDMEIFTPTLRKLWKEWELRALVLLSLTLQIILIFFGNRRKVSSKIWVRILLWCAYLMADWVATVALGVLLNNMGDVYEDKGKGVALDPDTQLTAFWAPFLLLHLGGPDTITAYSLEDNELWLRHFLGLGVQTGVALYIFLLAWTSSRFSILTMPMFLAGIIKYGERTWSLRSASNEELRDSMLTAPDPGPNYSKFMEEFTLKQCEGYNVVTDEVPESQVKVDVSSMGDTSIEGATELLKADYLFKTFKRLFVDLILSFQDRDSSQSLFSQITYEKAFKVIEIELGFMYDLLYTKGTIIYTSKGCWLRFISLNTTCIVLVFFSLSNKHDCLKIDIAITFLLLVIAILLELYAVLLLVSSDWTDLYLSKKNKGVLQQAITHLQLPKHQRWSNSLAQYSLLSYSLRSKPVINSKIQKLFGMDKIIEHLHMTSEAVTDDQKEFKDLSMCRGTRALHDFPALLWSVNVEFDQSILIWHIATILCDHADQASNEQKIEVQSEGNEQLNDDREQSGQNKQKDEVQSEGYEQINEDREQSGQNKQKDEVQSQRNEQINEDREQSGQNKQKNEVQSQGDEQINEDREQSRQNEQKNEVQSQGNEQINEDREHSRQNKQKDEVQSQGNEQINEDREQSGQNKQKDEVQSQGNEQINGDEEQSGLNKQKNEVQSEQKEQKIELPIGQGEQENEEPSGKNETGVLGGQSEHKTEVLSGKNDQFNEKNKQYNEKDCKRISKSLSQYMLYLLVMRPSMLTMGIGKIRFQDTCAEATKFFLEHESISGDLHKFKNICIWAINLFKEENFKSYETKACNVLLKVNTIVPPVKVKGDRSKSVLFDACRLASELQNIPKRWEVVSNVWVEMLAYAAGHCRGIYHAQQLGRGGELLTHVWLLMAHFGLTEQFQISQGHARAKLSVK